MASSRQSTSPIVINFDAVEHDSPYQRRYQRCKTPGACPNACTICMELFKRAKAPKILPCFHTFCEECLEGLSRSGAVLRCPTCGAKHNLPSTGVSGFSTNFTVANVVEFSSLSDPALGVPNKCENETDDNPAASKCLDCNFYLCKDCTTLHQKQRSTKNHNTVSISEIKSGGITQLSQKHYCTEHDGEELKLYCRTCQEAICRDCTIVTHKQHDYAFVKDVTSELMEKVENLSTSITRKDTELQAVLKHINKESRAEQEKLAFYNREARRFFDKCISANQSRIAALEAQNTQLRHHKTSLALDMTIVSSSHTKQLSAQKEEFILSRTRIASALAFSQQLLSSASSTDLATTSKLVTEQFEMLATLPSDKSLVRKSQWSTVLSNFNPLRSKAVDTSLVDNVIITMPRFAQLGSNDFLVSLKHVAEAVDPNVDFGIDVKASLSFGRICPVTIRQTRDQLLWSASFIINPPCPPKVTISVRIGGIETKDSPYCLPCRAGGVKRSRKSKGSTDPGKATKKQH